MLEIRGTPEIQETRETQETQETQETLGTPGTPGRLWQEVCVLTSTIVTRISDTDDEEHVCMISA